MTFGPEVVTAIMRHMNGAHADDSVLICRALGGEPDAVAATMTGLDTEAVDFRATVDGRDVMVRIPFSHRLTERAEVRGEVTRMYHEACARLGIAPRADE
jgi:putative heme iron utilization protein